MMGRKEGMDYAPSGKPDTVVGKGEFAFAAIGLDHGHIGGMCNGLMEAGAELKYIYDPDDAKLDAYCARYPRAKRARSEEEIFNDPAVRLVAGAAVTSERCALGLRVMDAGKDYFTDKAPLTTLEQLESAKAKVRETKRKYAVYYSERLHVEDAVFAGRLIEQGAIGRVIQTIGMGPHRLSAKSRPDWFFKKDMYGGILCDIGSHQIEQFLFYTGSKDATVVRSQIANYTNPEHPELDDFGDATLVSDNGATGYFRVDWFTPDGLSSWGDGRTFILGTEGYIELRKYVNITVANHGGRVFMANGSEEKKFRYRGQGGLSVLRSTDTRLHQSHRKRDDARARIQGRRAVRDSANAGRRFEPEVRAK